MDDPLLQRLRAELDALHETGLYQRERIIASPQRADIRLADGNTVINLCANNYLGLADHPSLRHAARQALDRYGYGMASVRFICGTQAVHKQLEARLSAFLDREDTILYSSCFDANTGLFEPLFDEQDAIISDALNHASLIDGIRLCKARRWRYANNNMAELEKCLQQTRHARLRLIVTDGVFSMDGTIANLPAICDLAERYDAKVMVDDSHAVGFLGANGRGTPEYWAVEGQIDIVTGTFSKALGGASGGYTAARHDIVDWLRQRSRPYLFSNTLTPMIAAAALTALDLIADGDELRARLWRNTEYFRHELAMLGFDLIPGAHPIIPILLGEARLARDMADRLLHKGIYVIGFSYPVVPQGRARIRTQLSATHTPAQLDRALTAFAEVGRELGVVT